MIIDLPSQFFSPRTLGIRYIVIHTTEGTDSRTWLTQTGGVSAHYLVREEGIYRLVDEDYAAWHAGRIVGTPTTTLYSGVWEDIYENGVLIGGGWTVNPNDECIGIEMEGFADRAVSPAILALTAELIRDIRSRRGMLPLVDHAELSPGDRHDPGAQNRAALDALLGEDDDMAFTDQDRANLQRVKDLLDAREQLVWTARTQRGLDVETGLPYSAAVPPIDPRIKQ